MRMSLVSQLTGALHRLQHVLRELTDYVTPRMITCHYDTRTIPFGHSNTHFGRAFPDNLSKVACKQEILREYQKLLKELNVITENL